MIAVILLCVGSVWLTLKATAEYPSFSDIAVTYPVNQVDGFELTIEKPSFSPFTGYTIRWKVTADSEDMYRFVQNGEAPNTFEYLEYNIGGQWHRLNYVQDNLPVWLDTAQEKLWTEKVSLAEDPTILPEDNILPDALYGGHEAAERMERAMVQPLLHALGLEK